LNVPSKENGETQAVREKYYCVLATKSRPLDIR